ncbi:MAG TPA: hypothetical protein VNF50_01100, partial [Acidimicrobiales bacterium]|nr:hypothetical protein [Acidimicrobiales bacterium]
DNPTLQANLYQALLQTFSGYSWWMGVAWWEWSDATGDAARTPRGKAAETLLRNWYVNGWRPAGVGTGGTPAATTTTMAAPGSAVLSGPGPGASAAGAAADPPSSSSGAGSSGAGTTGSGGTGASGSSASGPSGRQAAGATATSGPTGAISDPTTSPTLQSGQPYPLPLSSAGVGNGAGSVQAAGALASGRVVLSGAGGPGSRVTVDVVGALALMALAGISTSLPVILIGPVAAERRRRPRFQDEFDLD